MRTEEDEAFEELEKRMGRKEVKEVMGKLDAELDVYRNDVIEEVAKAVEEFRWAFGIDTVSSFAVFIRGLKNEQPRTRM
jgi:hypothetical protein